MMIDAPTLFTQDEDENSTIELEVEERDSQRTEVEESVNNSS